MVSNFILDYWPVVYFKGNTENIMTDELFEEYKQFYLSLLVKCKRNNEQMVLICDMNNVKDIQMKFVMKQSQFNKDIYKFNKQYVKGVCILCADKNFKNILNMFMGFTKPASPYKLCRSINKANAYLKEKLETDFNISIFFKENNMEIMNDNINEDDNEENEKNEIDDLIDGNIDKNNNEKEYEPQIDLEKYNSTPFL